jgi:hypothetical protein
LPAGFERITIDNTAGISENAKSMTLKTEDIDLDHLQHPLKQAKTSQYQLSTFVAAWPWRSTFDAPLYLVFDRLTPPSAGSAEIQPSNSIQAW